MDLGLKNKVILLAGNTSYISEGIRDILSAEGAIVSSVKKWEGYEPTAALCEQAVKEVVNQYERIDGLVNTENRVNNLGLVSDDFGRFKRAVQLNLVQDYLMAHFALPWLKKSTGPIVNVISAEEHRGTNSAHAGTYGGRKAITREWAVELLKYGIRVNSLIVSKCPARRDEILANGTHSTDQFKNSIQNQSDIANAVAFFLSVRSSHTTGQLFHVNGRYPNEVSALVNA